MKKSKKQVSAFLQDEKGTTAIEYAVIASLISIAIAASVTGIGSTVANFFTSVQNLF